MYSEMDFYDSFIQLNVWWRAKTDSLAIHIFSIHVWLLNLCYLHLGQYSPRVVYPVEHNRGNDVARVRVRP